MSRKSILFSIFFIVLFWFWINWVNQVNSNEVMIDWNQNELKTLNKPIEYTIKKEDTIESISNKYWVDKSWILYSNIWLLTNNLLFDENDEIELQEWMTILIPHIEWIAYKVLKWDNLIEVMNNFNISKEDYLKINWTYEIHPDDIVILPIPTFINDNQEIVHNYNWFVKWNCTYYVSQKVQWIDWSWDAKHWLINAEKKWHIIWNTPIKWAIVQFWWKSMPLWHVWYVEEVYEDWSFKISEMNFSKLWKITERVIQKDHKTIKWFIYLNESKKEYLSNNLSKFLAKSNLK